MDENVYLCICKTIKDKGRGICNLLIYERNNTIIKKYV